MNRKGSAVIPDNGDFLITVIVVNWNGKRFLGDCLGALRRQDVPGVRILLVDNGSEDGSVEFVEQAFPEVEILPFGRNLGFAEGNNRALERVGTEYVALLNNDAIPHPSWLKNLVRALERHPRAGFAASKMLFRDRPTVIDRAGDGYTTAGNGWLRGRGEDAGRFGEEEWVFGACAGAALYRSAMLENIGLFDNDFFILHEDVDLSFRAQLRGYGCIYVPDAVVFHGTSASIVRDSPISVYYGHRNLEWVYLKNMPAALIFRTIHLHLFYGIGSLLFFTLRGRGLTFLRAKFDALRGFPKMLNKRKQIQKKRILTNRQIRGLFREESVRRLCRSRGATRIAAF